MRGSRPPAGATSSSGRARSTSRRSRPGSTRSVGRWVLMYVPDPGGADPRARAAAQAGRHRRLQRDGHRVSRRAPCRRLAIDTELAGWMVPPEGFPGPRRADRHQALPDLRRGRPAGAGRCGWRSPLGGGPDWPGYAYTADDAAQPVAGAAAGWPHPDTPFPGRRTRSRRGCATRWSPPAGRL